MARDTEGLRRVFKKMRAARTAQHSTQPVFHTMVPATDSGATPPLGSMGVGLPLAQHSTQPVYHTLPDSGATPPLGAMGVLNPLSVIDEVSTAPLRAKPQQESRAPSSDFSFVQKGSSVLLWYTAPVLHTAALLCVPLTGGSAAAFVGYMLLYYSTTYWVLFLLCGTIFERYPHVGVSVAAYGAFAAIVVAFVLGAVQLQLSGVVEKVVMTLPMLPAFVICTAQFLFAARAQASGGARMEAGVGRALRFVAFLAAGLALWFFCQIFTSVLHEAQSSQASAGGLFIVFSVVTSLLMVLVGALANEVLPRSSEGFDTMRAVGILTGQALTLMYTRNLFVQVKCMCGGALVLLLLLQRRRRRGARWADCARPVTALTRTARRSAQHNDYVRGDKAGD